MPACDDPRCAECRWPIYPCVVLRERAKSPCPKCNDTGMIPDPDRGSGWGPYWDTPCDCAAATRLPSPIGPRFKIVGTARNHKVILDEAVQLPDSNLPPASLRSKGARRKGK